MLFRLRICVAACLLLAAAQPALAADQPVLGGAKILGLSARASASYAEFLLTNLPRAFAAAPDGSFAWVSDTSQTEDAVRQEALRRCALHGAAGCSIQVDGLRAEWPGAPVAQMAPGPLIQDSDHAFVPDNRFLWWGPQAARGVVVWGHGYGGEGKDERGLQPPPLIRAFNNAGFDVVRFDRAPFQDYPQNARGWLTDGLRALRRYGYHAIISGGQSRGGFDALWTLATPGLVDGVVAVAAAGSPGYAAEYNRSLYQADSPAARVVVVQFAEDIYGGTELDARTETLKRVLGPRVGALMIVDRPAGYTGHFEGMTLDFAKQFGACIVRFVTVAGTPPTCG